MEQIETLSDPSKIHVVFLHNRMKKRNEDRYMVDMATALHDCGHKVTICTSECDPLNCFEELDPISGKIDVIYSGWWLPNSLKCLRSVVMGLRMIFFPPKPIPKVLVLDINTIAVYMIHLLSRMKTIYLAHFSSLNCADVFTRFMQITPDLLTAKTLGYADDIVVQSETMCDVFRRSFPNVKKELTIMHPCVDTGLWLEQTISLDRIIPDIPKPHFLFVSFGTYRKRSNFKLILDAFEDLLGATPSNIKNNLHLVIAGNCNDLVLEQKLYYNSLLESCKDKAFGPQVTFLKQIPTVHKKTLINESIGVLLACKYEVFPDTTLAVLCSGRPIIATNTGFAKEALRHRVTAILVEPTRYLFAAGMYKLLMNPTIQVFLSDMGHDDFRKNYSYNVFTRKINSLISKQMIEDSSDQ